MLVLLSPAKSLDTSPSTIEHYTQPRLLKKSKALVSIFKKKSVEELQALMKVSEKIAQLNVQRFQSFSTPFSLENAKQAVLIFNGDVYRDLQASTFDDKDLAFAQKHLRILSGLYGVLRPLDLTHPYRLEMGIKLKNEAYKNLYTFWDTEISNILNKDLEQAGTDIVLNLASNEYLKSVKQKALKGRMVNVQFKEKRGDTYKVIAFNAKKARGAMARLIVKNKINELDAIKALNVNGYLYQPNDQKTNVMEFIKE